MSERQKPVKWWQILIGAALAAVVAVTVIWGVNAHRAAQAAEAEAVKQAQIAAAAQEAEFEALVVKFSSPAQVTPPPPPPPPVVEEPVVEEPVYEEPVYVPGQSGDYVPFIPSTDPNNAAGGDYIDPGIYCINGSASGNPPVCD